MTITQNEGIRDISAAEIVNKYGLRILGKVNMFGSYIIDQNGEYTAIVKVAGNDGKYIMIEERKGK